MPLDFDPAKLGIGGGGGGGPPPPPIGIGAAGGYFKGNGYMITSFRSNMQKISLVVVLVRTFHYQSRVEVEQLVADY